MSNFHPSLYLNDLQIESHRYAQEQGFWDHDDGHHSVDCEKIALMHSELSEALSALRDNDMPKVALELADTVIRIADYCEARGLDLRRAVLNVKEKSKSRPRLHGRTF